MKTLLLLPLASLLITTAYSQLTHTIVDGTIHFAKDGLGVTAHTPDYSFVFEGADIHYEVVNQGELGWSVWTSAHDRFTRVESVFISVDGRIGVAPWTYSTVTNTNSEGFWIEGSGQAGPFGPIFREYQEEIVVPAPDPGPVLARTKTNGVYQFWLDGELVNSYNPPEIPKPHSPFLVSLTIDIEQMGKLGWSVRTAEIEGAQVESVFLDLHGNRATMGWGSYVVDSVDDQGVHITPHVLGEPVFRPFNRSPAPDPEPETDWSLRDRTLYWGNEPVASDVDWFVIGQAGDARFGSDGKLYNLDRNPAVGPLLVGEDANDNRIPDHLEPDPEPPTYTLSIVAPAIGSVDGGGSYVAGEIATVIASPSLGYLFTGWTGDASGNSNPLSVTVNEDLTVGASFTQDTRDTDGDGLTNYQELITYNSNPTSSDSDDDGLSDGAEINTYLSNPNNSDSDSDGFSDGTERRLGTDPLSDSSFPADKDWFVDSLLAFYPLNGSGADVSTMQNHSVADGQVKYAENRFGFSDGALLLENQEGHLVAPHQDYLNPRELTVSCWMLTTDGTSSGAGLVTKYYPAHWNGWALLYNGTYEVHAAYGVVIPWYLVGHQNTIIGDYGREPFLAENTNDGNWHHILFTVSDNSGKVYVDGILADEQPWDGTPMDSTTGEPLRIGRYASHLVFEGLIDDVRIYGKSMTSGEVVLNYNYEAGLTDGDGDGVNDYLEREHYLTNHQEKDSDGDGIEDLEEINGGTDPNDPNDPERFVERALPLTYLPGQRFTVQLNTRPRQGTDNYALSDKPPTNWVVSSISGGGFFDSVNGEVKFGPFIDDSERILTYVVTPPVEAAGRYSFSGEASADGSRSLIQGHEDIDVFRPHPVDVNPEDSCIGIDEVTAYGSAWKQGVPWGEAQTIIPVGYYTRAGFLWRRGECYNFDSRLELPLAWIPLTQAAPVEAAVGEFRIARQTLGANAVASMPFKTVPENAVRFQVQIEASPMSETFVYAVEESVPEGITVDPEAISYNGAWDLTNRKVRWGPFFDDTRRTLSYDATVPEGASEALLFQGIFSADGKDISISGDRLMTSRPPLRSYANWRQQAFENPEGDGAEKGETNRSGTSNLLSYALGWKNSEDGLLPLLESEVVDESGNEAICFVFQKSKTAANVNYSVEVSASLREPEIVYSLEQAELVGETDHAWIYKIVLDTPANPKRRRFAVLRITEISE